MAGPYVHYAVADFPLPSPFGDVPVSKLKKTVSQNIDPMTAPSVLRELRVSAGEVTVILLMMKL